MLSRKKLIEAQNNEKLVYYDYIAYKRAIGWLNGIYEDDWYRPEKINKATYFAEFLKRIPDYYFLGIPVVELIKSTHSKGLSPACCVALSLCFENFDICICDMLEFDGKTYNKYKHVYLLIYINNKSFVIDTEYGMITNKETYNGIFGIENEIHITSKKIKNTDFYHFLSNNKNKKAPNYIDEINETSDYKKYVNYINEFRNLCKIFDSSNKNFKFFVNKLLYSSTDKEIFSTIRSNIYLDFGNSKIKYPLKSLNSLIDDKTDNILYGRSNNAILSNERVLESYNKRKEYNFNHMGEVNKKLIAFIRKISFNIF